MDLSTDIERERVRSKSQGMLDSESDASLR